MRPPFVIGNRVKELTNQQGNRTILKSIIQMKTTLTALVLSASLLGYATAEPKQDKKKSAPQKVEKKADRKKAKPAPKKSKEAVAREKADRAKKAAAAAAKKKTDEKKMVKDAIAKIEDLNAKKKAAESTRNKAADALRAADRNVAAIEKEIKDLSAMLKAKADNDRKKAEQEKARQLRDTEANERALVATMKKELQALKQTVDQLKKQLQEKK